MGTDYYSLIDQLFALIGLKGPTRHNEIVNITLGGIPFCLMCSAQSSGDTVLVLVNFGAPPENFRSRVLERLLEANVIMQAPHRPSFGINHATGDIVLSASLPVRNATGDWLLKVLMRFAEQASEWRQTYFLLDEERSAIPISEASARFRNTAAV